MREMQLFLRELSFLRRRTLKSKAIFHIILFPNPGLDRGADPMSRHRHFMDFRFIVVASVRLG